MIVKHRKRGKTVLSTLLLTCQNVHSGACWCWEPISLLGTGLEEGSNPLREPASSKIRDNYEWDVYFMCQDSFRPIRVSESTNLSYLTICEFIPVGLSFGALTFLPINVLHRGRMRVFVDIHPNYTVGQQIAVWLHKLVLIVWNPLLGSRTQKFDPWRLTRDMRVCDNNSVPIISPMGELS